MFARMLTILLLTASFLRADAIIEVELVPDNPGPYYGGEEITVDVWLENLTDEDYFIRIVQLDFADTDRDISLDTQFAFDLSSVPFVDWWDVYPDLPVPYAQMLVDWGGPEPYLPLDASGTVHIGSVGLTLPTELGVWTVDALNADEPGLGGAEIITDLSPHWWSANDGEIVGGQLIFVVPEPATILLLGAAFAAHHSYRRIRARSVGVRRTDVE